MVIWVSLSPLDETDTSSKVGSKDVGKSACRDIVQSEYSTTVERYTVLSVE
jgi:hypothetical protein